MSTLRLPSALKRDTIKLSPVTLANRKAAASVSLRHSSMLGLRISSSAVLRGSASRFARAALECGRDNAEFEGPSSSGASSVGPGASQLRPGPGAQAPAPRPAPSSQRAAAACSTSTSIPPSPKLTADDTPASAPDCSDPIWSLGHLGPVSRLTSPKSTIAPVASAQPLTCASRSSISIGVTATVTAAANAAATSSSAGMGVSCSASSRRLETSDGTVVNVTEVSSTCSQRPTFAKEQQQQQRESQSGTGDAVSERWGTSTGLNASSSSARGEVCYHLNPNQQHHDQQRRHHSTHPSPPRTSPQPRQLHLHQRSHPHPHPRPQKRSVQGPHAAAPHHPTLRLIASRLRSGSRPGARRDGARLGLVVEGGGMRGCVSGAMLMALHDMGLTHVFDVVYGASAGAINATYFLAGQRHGLRVYYEDLTQGNAFLDFRNLFSSSSRPVMNIDFLIDTVMTTSKPLDWDAVLTSPTPLKVVASCIDSLQPVLLSDFADRQELAAALKATAAVPQLAGPPRVVRGRSLVDAAVFEPVPVPTAIRDGCSHVLVLCTRPAPTRGSPWAKRVQSTIEVLAKTTVLNAPYMREAWRTARSPCFASRDEQLVAALRSCPHEFRRTVGAYVLPVYPEHTAGCHPLCLDPATLQAACEVGHATLLGLLGPLVEAVSGAASGRGGAAAAAAGLEDVDGALGLPYGEGLGEQVTDSCETREDGAPGQVSETVVAGAVAGGGGGRGGGGSFGSVSVYPAGMSLRFRP